MMSTINLKRCQLMIENWWSLHLCYMSKYIVVKSKYFKLISIFLLYLITINSYKFIFYGKIPYMCFAIDLLKKYVVL